MQKYVILCDFLDIIIFLSIKVNCSPCLVSLHEIMDKLFIPLPSTDFFLFSLNYFGSIYNKSIKSISVASRPTYLVCMVSLLSQRNLKTGVAELKLSVIDTIIL